MQAHKDKLSNETDAGLTTSHAAIAATVSIVLWQRKNEPRALSLLPPVPFVIVAANKIYSNFTSLISTQQWRNKLSTNIVLVSSPLKNAYIQQTLAYGPKGLIILLLYS